MADDYDIIFLLSISTSKVSHKTYTSQVIIPDMNAIPSGKQTAQRVIQIT